MRERNVDVGVSVSASDSGVVACGRWVTAEHRSAEHRSAEHRAGQHCAADSALENGRYATELHVIRAPGCSSHAMQLRAASDAAPGAASAYACAYAYVGGAA